ncbi:hypothetical protein FN846DRAFT_966054 [Sphaerosporella brunnea]|uniref:Adhesin domain-containing protein n=1 Tax=Sphaerosporella brunnea TaxID=1250544 RepID=A0A5J5EM05_9PEZI|nr:hypothetical protein FN846DRAFT_966054 [Sphaerosporella brunnea]
MTDANGFYRPRDLPQDVPDPRPSSDSDSDSDSSIKNQKKKKQQPHQPYAESESGASSVTYLNSPTTRTRASSSAASYIFPDMRDGRRSPVSMRDYGRFNPAPAYPRFSFEYGTPLDQRSEYTPSASASVYTPQTTTFAPSTENYSPPASLYSPPAANYVPLLPAMSERGRAHGSYGTAPELPMYVTESAAQPQKRRRRIPGCIWCLRSFFLVIILIPLLLWLLRGVSARFYADELPPGCPNPRNAFQTKGTYSLLPASTFTFIENARDVILGGEVTVHLSTDAEAENVSVDYSITSTTHDAVQISISDDGVVQVQSKHRADRRSACAMVHISITLPHSLQALSLRTHTLPQYVDGSVSVDALVLDTKYAGIHSLATARNSTRASADTGSISGTFSLAKSLVLATSSGSIHAGIKPLDIPEPTADLVAKTATGSIVLDVVGESPPPARNYTSAVTSSSGSIGGTFLFGAAARFEAVAGSLDLQLLPVKYQDVLGTLRTESKHGATRVSFTSGLAGKQVEGWHGAITGAVAVHYPRDFEGKISASATLGQVAVSGEGIEIEKRSWGMVEGYKGDRTKGSVEVSGHVGEVSLRIE